jgi:hypothetical protein
VLSEPRLADSPTPDSGTIKIGPKSLSEAQSDALHSRNYMISIERWWVRQLRAQQDMKLLMIPFEPNFTGREMSSTSHRSTSLPTRRQFQSITML